MHNAHRSFELYIIPLSKPWFSWHGLLCIHFFFNCKILLISHVYVFVTNSVPDYNETVLSICIYYHLMFVNKAILIFP